MPELLKLFNTKGYALLHGIDHEDLSFDIEVWIDSFGTTPEEILEKIKTKVESAKGLKIKTLKIVGFTPA